MARNDFKRNEKLYQVALRRDWTYSLKLAAIGFVCGVLLIPALLAADPDLHPLSRAVSFVAWVFSIGFTGIAAYRFHVQRGEKQTEDNS
jgi:hypothetical protein